MATITPKVYTTKNVYRTLNSLANAELRGKTTAAVLNAMNPKWVNKTLPIRTDILYLKTTDYNKYRTQQAEKAKAAAAKKKKEAADKLKSQVPPNGNRHAGSGRTYKGLTVVSGQFGVIVVLKEMSYYTKDKSNKLKKAGTFKKSETYRVMGKDNTRKTYILEKSRHVYISDIGKYDYYEVPLDLDAAKGNDPADKGTTKIPTEMEKIFAQPSYRRPMLRYKDKNGKFSNIVELRLNSFTQNLSTDINPVRTNAGWYLQVSGEGLSTITLSGFVMDTKALREFTAFMHVYHAYLKAKKSGDYVKIPTIKLNYKNREYTAIVRALSINDTAEARLRVAYSMELMVLAEKAIGTDAIKDLPSYTNPNLEDTTYYYMNPKALFRNTVTGKTTAGT